MEPPNCIQDEPFPHPLEPGPGKPGDKRFWLWYVGGSCLDRRTTLPMLPWLMAEIRRRSQKPEAGACGAAREVLLVLSAPFVRCIPAAQPGPAVFIFEHKAQHIARFVHNSHDLTYFAYLIKAQPDDPESQMACHVFRATDPNQARARFRARDGAAVQGAGLGGRPREAQGAWAPSGQCSGTRPPRGTARSGAAGAQGTREQRWARVGESRFLGDARSLGSPGVPECGWRWPGPPWLCVRLCVQEERGRSLRTLQGSCWSSVFEAPCTVKPSTLRHLHVCALSELHSGDSYQTSLAAEVGVGGLSH